MLYELNIGGFVNFYFVNSCRIFLFLVFISRILLNPKPIFPLLEEEGEPKIPLLIILYFCMFPIVSIVLPYNNHIFF